MNVEFGGTVTDPYGQTKAGFTVTGKISRKAFGITYGAATETGGVLLGDEIKVNAEIQLVKQVLKQQGSWKNQMIPDAIPGVYLL